MNIDAGKDKTNNPNDLDGNTTSGVPTFKDTVKTIAGTYPDVVHTAGNCARSEQAPVARVCINLAEPIDDINKLKAEIEKLAEPYKVIFEEGHYNEIVPE